MNSWFSKFFLFVGLVGSFTPAHAVSYSVSSFNTHRQTGDTCWASVLKMVLSHRGREEKICNILSNVKGENCCGGFLGIGVPNVCYTRHSSMTAFNVYNLKYELVQAPPERQTAVFKKIAESIRANKMPAFRYQNANNLSDTHIVVIEAIHNAESPANAYFDIVDPAVGRYRLSAGQLKKAFVRSDNSSYYLVGAYIPY